MIVVGLMLSTQPTHYAIYVNMTTRFYLDAATCFWLHSDDTYTSSL